MSDEHDQRGDSIRKCGVDVVSRDISNRLAKLGPGYKGTDPSAQTVALTEGVIADAVSKYPVGLCRCAELNEILLVEYLFAPGDGYTIAFVNPRNRVMVLSVDRLDQNLLLERRFHHELFHAIDHAFDEKVDKDEEWMKLNRSDFAYGPPERASSTSWQDILAPGTVVGFLSQYGTYSPAEDKAEIFSFLFAMPEFVERRVAEDAVVAKKVDLLKSRVKLACPHVMLEGVGRPQSRSR